MKDHAQIASAYHAGFAGLANEIPDATAAFGRLVMEATATSDIR